MAFKTEQNKLKISRNIIFTDPFEEEYLVSAVMRNNELCRKTDSEFRNREVCSFEINKLDYNPSSAFGGLFDKQNLYSYTLHPIGILFDRVRYQNMTLVPREHLRICTQCVVEDFENLGTAFIHRTHVAPRKIGALVCHLHAVPLSDFCPTCRVEIKHHKLNQLSACINRKSKIKAHSSMGSTTHQYSKFIYEILKKANLKKYTRYSALTIGKSLENLGYSSSSFDSYFRYCIDADNKTGTPIEVYQTARETNRNPTRTPVHLFTRVAFLLYGSLENFIHEIEEFHYLSTRI